MVIVGSEFGRTPKISKLNVDKLHCRDHWGAAQSMLFAGGGVQGGIVIGATDRIGAYPVNDPQTPENLAATIYSTLGIPRDAHWQDPAGRLIRSITPHRSPDSGQRFELNRISRWWLGESGYYERCE